MRARRGVGLFVLVAPLLVSGCGGNGQSTLHPASHAARSISTLWWVMLVASAVIFGVVVLLLAVALLRRRGPEAPARGVAFFGTPFVLVGGLAVPAVLLLALFVLTLVVLPKTSPAARAPGAAHATAGADGADVVVTGRQWFWDVDYPDEHVRTANEIHLPVGVTTTVEAKTADVIHSLWIPELNRKIDMIPGQTNTIRIRPLRVGVYRGQCAEFCGLQHAHMALYVVVESAGDYHRWLRQESLPAAQPGSNRTEHGEQVFLSSACVYCHTISGTNASGKVGPDLTHVASRMSLAAGTLPNTIGYLAGWILDPQHVKPGNRMPATALSGPDLQSLLDYLESLR